jgi:hypothetical protein
MRYAIQLLPSKVIHDMTDLNEALDLATMAVTMLGVTLVRVWDYNEVTAYVSKRSIDPI